MPFSDIDDLGLKRFVLRERDEASLWLFMHIPKTAGSSLSESMQRLAHPYKNIQVDYQDDTKSHNEKLGISTDQFIDSHAVRKYRSASGHVPYDLVSKIRASVPETKIITFLRDPVSRVVSDYRYQRTPAHPPHVEFKARFPTIESYVDSIESQNKIARFVGGRGVDLEAIDLIGRLDIEFTFVGLLEMYPLSYNIMFNLLGVAGEFPATHSRKTPDTPDTKVEITDSIVSRIKKNNQLDLDLFNHVKARLVRVKEEWQGYLQSGFPAEW